LGRVTERVVHLQAGDAGAGQGAELLLGRLHEGLTEAVAVTGEQIREVPDRNITRPFDRERVVYFNVASVR
jgi:hypothetical protein